MAYKSPNFSKNLSMSAIVIASLATSPKNTKCPPLATSQRWDCQSAKIKHIKVCVQNILRMLEYKLDDVNACLTAYWRSSGWNVAILPSDATSAGRRRHESGCGTHTLQLPPDPVVYRVDVSTVGWPEIGVSLVKSDRLRRISCLRFTFITCQQTSLPNQWSH